MKLIKTHFWDVIRTRKRKKSEIWSGKNYKLIKFYSLNSEELIEIRFVDKNRTKFCFLESKGLLFVRIRGSKIKRSTKIFLQNISIEQFERDLIKTGIFQK